MIEICLKETGKTDNYLISLGPFHIVPVPLMSAVDWEGMEEREMEGKREGEEERQHRGGYGGEEGWKRDEVLSMMCEAHSLERPGSKKKLHIHFKRGGTAIWKWFLNCLCKMANAMILCLVVVLFFQWKIALLRKKTGEKKLLNWPGTKGCATVLIVTMVTRRISHFTTGIEGAHWGLSQTLSLLFFFIPLSPLCLRTRWPVTERSRRDPGEFPPAFPDLVENELSTKTKSTLDC